MKKIQLSERNVGSIERALSIAVGGALILSGFQKRSDKGGRKSSWLSRAILTAAGSGFVQRGLSGHCEVYQSLHLGSERSSFSKISRHKIRISQPRTALYQFWRNFENAPRFMPHIKRVQALDSDRSKWVAYSPINTEIHWESRITEESENQSFGWKVVSPHALRMNGRVEFKDLSNGQETEVTATITYEVPGGTSARAFGWMFGKNPDRMNKDTLRHFKELMESEEAPTQQGRPPGQEVA